MTPYLVTAPVADVVSLASMRAHLRIDANDTSHDAQIGELIDAAVAHLDGWRGVLGRCIMSQTWAVDYEDSGTLVLPMPDVSSVTVDYGEGAGALDFQLSGAGPVVELTAAGTVQFTCAMPVELLPVAVSAVKLLVERDFDRPTGPEYDALMRSVDALIAAIRWRR